MIQVLLRQNRLGHVLRVGVKDLRDMDAPSRENRSN